MSTSDHYTHTTWFILTHKRSKTLISNQNHPGVIIARYWCETDSMALHFLPRLHYHCKAIPTSQATHK
jgi:hypothetical protein